MRAPDAHISIECLHISIDIYSTVCLGRGVGVEDKTADPVLELLQVSVYHWLIIYIDDNAHK